MTLYSILGFYDIYDHKWYQKLWKRIKTAVTLIFGGYPQVHDSFLFNGPKAIEDYIEALQTGLNKLKKYEESLKVKENK